MRIPSTESTLAAAVLLGCSSIAAAHDAAPDGNERVVVSAGFGLMSLHADQPYPARRLAGILEAGAARTDERRDGLDYAEAAIRARLTPWLEGFAKLAHHGGRDARNETEEAWLDAHSDIPGDGQLTLRAGRQMLPLGFVNPVHLHAREFGIAPLVLRATINDAWQADGFNLTWHAAHGLYAGTGAWRNRGFPGADAGGMKLLHARAGWQGGDTQVEAGYANVNADGRALITLGSAGHNHGVPSCTILASDRLCFDGTAQLLTLAVRWTPAASPFKASAEWWYKHDAGRLDSLDGTQDYTGRINGGWIDAGWRFSPGWEVIGRSERVIARHTLLGPNAALVAARSGIADAGHPLFSQGAVLQWQPGTGHRLSAEWHRERSDASTAQVYLLRYQYRFAKGLF